MNHYNKLIRDNIPGIETRKGKKISYHDARAEEEYWYALRAKLQEAMDEFIVRLDLDSLGDVYDVLDAIIEFKKINRKELAAHRQNKNNKLGGFTKHWILEASQDEIGHRQEQEI